MAERQALCLDLRVSGLSRLRLPSLYADAPRGPRTAACQPRATLTVRFAAFQNSPPTNLVPQLYPNHFSLLRRYNAVKFCGPYLGELCNAYSARNLKRIDARIEIASPTSKIWATSFDAIGILPATATTRPKSSVQFPLLAGLDPVWPVQQIRSLIIDCWHR